MLSHHFRQKDRELFTLLNEVRLGSLSPVSLGLLSTLSVAANTSFTSEDNVGRKAQAVAGSAFPLSLAKEEHNSRKRSKGRDGFTILRARRADVDTFNTEKFDELGTEIYTYKGIHRGEGSFPLDLPETVKVRVGCRVMLLANIDLNLGLANGCVGIVESFINVNQAFNLTNSTTKEDTRALAKHEMLPVVRFDTRDNASGKSNEGEVPSCRIVTIEPHRWTTRQGEDEISCTTQIPLQLAYAITIHKSQGMSLSHVNVDFNGIFEEGQAYVALSRCTNIANLVIENFNARQVNPNVKALAYYKALDVIISKQHEEELKLVEEGHRMHPWGPYEVDGFDDESSENQPEDKQHGGHFYYDPENIACMIERCRKEFLPQYTMYSTVRRWVLSKIDAAFILSGSLLVMDTTSLLALTIPIGCGGSAYQKIFSSRGNMMRVPRVVKEELLGVIATGDTALEEELSQNLTPLPILTYSTACSNSQRTSKNFYNIIEAADKAIAIMEDAKREFLLDEQREGERAALPPVLRVWEPFSQMLMLGPDSNDCHQEEKTNVTAFCSDATPQHRSILEFARFLEGRYSTSSPVFVCTETVELAARAMAIGLRVCSVAYLCSRVK
uniref:Putative DNA repair and recombination helicase protein PIF1 n=1 Tax=Trypanosoma congolense (strain IL3000) TaxID=1068625 RepID=G0UR10_TRYCI|nr:putative DNA repair and recombination helicase protein PIF1 [Trypanosoma congolense IL3000]